MTAIICWLNKENAQNPSLWIVGDTLISQRTNQGVDPLSNFAHKIFAIPIICKTVAPNGFFTKPYLVYNIGFASAGSATITYIVVEKLRYCLANLGDLSGGKTPPCLDEIVNLLKEIIEEIARDIGQNKNQRVIFESLLFGYCHACKSLKVFKISLDYTCNPFKVISSKIYFNDDNLLVQLGGKQTEIKEIIEGKRKSKTYKDIQWWRAPHNAMKEIIQNGQFEGIGGETELGFMIGPEFEIVMEMEFKLEKGKPGYKLSLGGINIEKLNNSLKSTRIIAKALA